MISFAGDVRMSKLQQPPIVLSSWVLQKIHARLLKSPSAGSRPRRNHRGLTRHATKHDPYQERVGGDAWDACRPCRNDREGLPRRLARNRTATIKLTHYHEAGALDLMAEAIRQYPRSHIRVRRNIEIIAERVPPRNPK
jgi:hypothetical protein